MACLTTSCSGPSRRGASARSPCRTSWRAWCSTSSSTARTRTGRGRRTNADPDIAADRLDPVVPERIVIGRDGLLVRRGRVQGLLLPQVASEHGFGAEAFLRAVCHKAGLPAGSWQEPGTQVFTFTADILAE